MDKQQNSKLKNNNIFKMVPKAMSFGQRLAPFSPGRDLHHHHQTTSSGNRDRSFMSGPIARLVPVETRLRRTGNDGVLDEPTSPKVSCIGQIKLAKTKCSEKTTKNIAPSAKHKTTLSYSREEEDGARPSMIKRMFSSAGAKTPGKSHPASAAGDLPSLGQMKKFASSREALAGFDWTAEMNREESPAEESRRRCYSNEETRVMAYSAPLSLEPKKEVNLWKRRTMNPPRPLQIKRS